MYNETTIQDVKDFVLNWNIRYPIDRWWREKHKVSFNSNDHRVSSFIDQLIEYEEDKFFRKMIKEQVEDEIENNKPIPYIPGTGNFLSKKEPVQVDSEKAFQDTNLDDFKFDE